MKIDSWGLIKQMSLQGYGIGLIPDYLVSGSERKFIIESYNIGEIRYSISLYHTAGSKLSMKSTKLIEMLKPMLN